MDLASVYIPSGSATGRSHEDVRDEVLGAMASTSGHQAALMGDINCHFWEGTAGAEAHGLALSTNGYVAIDTVGQSAAMARRRAHCTWTSLRTTPCSASALFTSTQTIRSWSGSAVPTVRPPPAARGQPSNEASQEEYAKCATTRRVMAGITQRVHEVGYTTAPMEQDIVDELKAIATEQLGNRVSVPGEGRAKAHTWRVTKASRAKRRAGRALKRCRQGSEYHAMSACKSAFKAASKHFAKVQDEEVRKLFRRNNVMEEEPRRQPRVTLKLS